MEILKVQRLSPFAQLPVRGSKEAAGLDLSSVEDAKILPGQRKCISTGLAIKAVPGTYARIAPRSGLASKKCVDVGAGVIDADYCGPVSVILINNHPTETFVVKRGDRVAQLICEKIAYPQVSEVSSLCSTKRGTKGFGSTGVHALDKDAERSTLQQSVRYNLEIGGVVVIILGGLFGFMSWKSRSH